MDSCVDIRGVSKSFGGVRALRDVSLDIRPGEVHALCGENGAGKSTLIKVLSGVYRPDTGRVVAWGSPLPLGDVRGCENAGVAVIHQESAAFADLDAADNIFVGREPVRLGGLLLDRRRMRSLTRQLMARAGAEAQLGTPVGEMSVARRQMVSLARALSHSCRLLILDEPTASLSGKECEVLFGIIRQLRADGVSILYVSHRLEEVFALSDRVTVLRDGQLVGTCPTADVDRAELIAMMVGRELEALSVGPPARPPGDKPMLEVAGLGRRGVFEDITLAVRPGEIVGLAGLVGAGRSELARAIFGIDRPDAGRVVVAGRRLPGGSCRAAMSAGVALVPEDRQHVGLIQPMSVSENLTLAVLGSMTTCGLLSAAREKDFAERLIGDLGIRAPAPSAPTETLSGGNQQKVMVAKWLGTAPRVLILDEPTRGVDVAAKADIHRLIRELTDRGLAALVISSDLPELLGLADRIVVMRAGRISGELSRGQATQQAVLHLALPDSPDQSPGEPGAPAARPPPEAKKGTGTAKQQRSQSPFSSPVGGLLARREFGVMMLLAATAAVVSYVNPSFLAGGNIRDMLVNIAPVAIVACGMTLVIVTGEIDISVGSLMGLTAAVLGLLSSVDHAGLPVPIAAAAAVGLATAVGTCTGLLVVVGRVPSIIVTLGMLTALRGATEFVMGGQWISGLPPDLRYLGTGRPMGVPVCIWVAGAVVALSIVLTRQTPLGRRIYAVGSNPSAARLAGVSAGRIKLLVFALTGLLVGVATIVSVPQLSVIESGIGVGFELLVVTCVVVGGTSIRGGRGSIVGSLLAAGLLVTIGTVLIYLKLGPGATYWQRAIQGGFILLAVLVDHLARPRRREMLP